MVEHRTKLMKMILKQIEPDARSNMLGQAYFVAVLSLMDSVCEKSLEDILDSLNVDDVVKDALLYESGMLGEIIALVKDIELFNIEKVCMFEKKYKLKEAVFNDLILQSMREIKIFEDEY